MCGIYGFQWKQGHEPSVWRRTAMALMLGVGNAERGTHSWGMYSLEAGIKKGLGSVVPVAHVARKFNAVLAHTRYATHGKKTVDNAHPFQLGNIIGAHNGIIYNHRTLSEKYNRTFEVDSMHILAHLDGGLPLSELEGYGAFEWVDMRELGTIHLAKLSDRGELCIVATDFGVIWTSDKDHMKQALAAAAITKYTDYKVDTGKHYVIQNGELFFREGDNVAITGSSVVDSRTSGYTSMYGQGWSHGYGWSDEDQKRWESYYAKDDTGADDKKDKKDEREEVTSPGTVELTQQEKLELAGMGYSVCCGAEICEECGDCVNCGTSACCRAYSVMGMDELFSGCGQHAEPNPACLVCLNG